MTEVKPKCCTGNQKEKYCAVHKNRVINSKNAETTRIIIQKRSGKLPTKLSKNEDKKRKKLTRIKS